jgi:molybdopterin converting factor small subunit
VYNGGVTIDVEFFGIPRQRAGRASARVETSAARPTLGDVLAELAARFPELAATCIDGRKLRPGYTVSLGGKRFLADPEASLEPGECLFLLSSDAGG